MNERISGETWNAVPPNPSQHQSFDIAQLLEPHAPVLDPGADDASNPPPQTGTDLGAALSAIGVAGVLRLFRLHNSRFDGLRELPPSAPDIDSLPDRPSHPDETVIPQQTAHGDIVVYKQVEGTHDEYEIQVLQRGSGDPPDNNNNNNIAAGSPDDHRSDWLERFVNWMKNNPRKAGAAAFGVLVGVGATAFLNREQVTRILLGALPENEQIDLMRQQLTELVETIPVELIARQGSGLQGHEAKVQEFVRNVAVPRLRPDANLPALSHNQLLAAHERLNDLAVNPPSLGEVLLLHELKNLRQSRTPLGVDYVYTTTDRYAPDNNRELTVSYLADGSTVVSFDDYVTLVPPNAPRLPQGLADRLGEVAQIVRPDNVLTAPAAPVDVAAEVYNQLALDPEDLTQIVRFARDPATTPDQLRMLAEVSRQPSVLDAITANPNTPGDALRHIYDTRFSSTTIKLNLAANPNTPPVVLRSIATDIAPIVRSEVLANPNVPDDALRAIAELDAGTPNGDRADRILRDRGLE